MTNLSKIERNWKGLWDILNSIGGHVNARTPRSGDGINITESPNGFIIALKRDQQAQPDPKLGITDEGSTASWRQLTVIDPSDCSKKYIWYWGTAPVTSQTAKAPTSRPISTAQGGSFIPVIKQ
jgi:hypothetical protein